jgi:hypothetical protein
MGKLGETKYIPTTYFGLVENILFTTPAMSKIYSRSIVKPIALILAILLLQKANLYRQSANSRPTILKINIEM